jgi:peptidoglycan/LPS O-acetylase OafA/YrhL
MGYLVPTQIKGSDLLANEKRHFVFLDGMRGIAALAVGCLHASTFFNLRFEPHHASLAVDFFFALSGFVIAYAYDSKFRAGMTLADFAVKRLIRLYPLIFIGVLLGSVITVPLAIVTHGDLKLAVFLCLSALFLLPLGIFFGQQSYPVNNPIWSLFLELIANAVYGLSRGRQRPRSVLPLVILGLSALALVVTIHHFLTIEDIGFTGRVRFALGLVRVCFPFLAGVLIYRYRLFAPRFAYFDWLAALMLAAIFASPYFSKSWLYDSVSIVIVFPLLISLGANDSTNSFANAVWKTSGNLSYPFYVVHQPIIRAASILYQRSRVQGISPEAGASAAILFAGAVSYFIFVVYDRPLRRWLTKVRERSIGRTANDSATNQFATDEG